MKYAIILTSDTGKTIKIAGNERIEVQAIVGNQTVARYVLAAPEQSTGWHFRKQ